MVVHSFLRSPRSGVPTITSSVFRSVNHPKSFTISVVLSAVSLFAIAALFHRSHDESVALIMTENRVSSVYLEPEFQFFVSACVIVRQSSDIMPEFIVRNYMAGVDHFYIYGDDEDDPTEVSRLRKLFSSFGGIVTYISDGRSAPNDEEDPETYVQMRMYRHCLEEFGSQTKWMAFIDSDEFFETYALPILEIDSVKRTRRAFIHDILSKHEAFPVLCVRWRSALTNGRMLPPQEGEFLHDLFPRTCMISMIDNGKLAYKKTVLQTKYVDLDASPKLDDAIHRGFSFKGPGPYPNLSCKSDLGKDLEPAIHLVHYWSRDLTSYLRKIQRGRPRKTVPARKLMDLYLREKMCEPEGMTSSTDVRYEYIRGILKKLSFIPEAATDLPSTDDVLGVGTEKSLEEVKKGKNIHFCPERVEKTLKALEQGREFASTRYCHGRISSACSVFEEGRRLQWPFPWAEYLTECDDTGNQQDFFH